MIKILLIIIMSKCNHNHKLMDSDDCYYCSIDSIDMDEDFDSPNSGFEKEYYERLIEDGKYSFLKDLISLMVEWSPTAPLLETKYNIVEIEYPTYNKFNINPWEIKCDNYEYNILKVNLRWNSTSGTLRVYEKEVIVNGRIMSISNIPKFKKEYTHSSNIIESIILSEIVSYPIYTYTFVKYYGFNRKSRIDTVYKLAPRIINLNKAHYLAIMWMLYFEILPVELINIIYKLLGGNQPFIPDIQHLKYSDFQSNYVPIENFGICTKDQLKKLYVEKKFSIYECRYVSPLNLSFTGNGHMHTFTVDDLDKLININL